MLCLRVLDRHELLRSVDRGVDRGWAHARLFVAWVWVADWSDGCRVWFQTFLPWKSFPWLLRSHFLSWVLHNHPSLPRIVIFSCEAIDASWHTYKMGLTRIFRPALLREMWTRWEHHVAQVRRVWRWRRFVIRARMVKSWHSKWFLHVIVHIKVFTIMAFQWAVFLILFSVVFKWLISRAEPMRGSWYKYASSCQSLGTSHQAYSILVRYIIVML